MANKLKEWTGGQLSFIQFSANFSDTAANSGDPQLTNRIVPKNEGIKVYIMVTG